MRSSTGTQNGPLYGVAGPSPQRRGFHASGGSGFLVRLVAIARRLQKVVGRYRLVADLGQLEDEIDGLVLEDRRPQAFAHLGVLAVELENLAFLARIALGFADHRLVDL